MSNYIYPTGEVRFTRATYGGLVRWTCDIQWRDEEGAWALGPSWYIQEKYQWNRIHEADFDTGELVEKKPPPIYHLTPDKPTGIANVGRAWLIEVGLRPAKEFVRLLLGQMERYDRMDNVPIWKDRDALYEAVVAFGDKYGVDVSALVRGYHEERIG